jgi:hypothetical protein
MNLPVDQGQVPEQCQSLHHSLITMEQSSWLSVICMVQTDRTNQNSGILFSLWKDSLTLKALVFIDLEPDQYTINDEVEGLCLLKHIFSKVHVNTNAMVGTLRIQVASLDTKLMELKNDIKQ